MSENVIGPLFLEGPDCTWELYVKKTPDGIVPYGIRDAHTNREPEKMPEAKQFQFAMELWAWASINDPETGVDARTFQGGNSDAERN